MFKFKISGEGGCCGFWEKIKPKGFISARTSNTASIYKDRFIIITGGE